MRSNASVCFSGAMVAAPRSELVPALRLKMPDNFTVELIPANPLSLGNALGVRAVRTHRGGRKTDWGFNLSSHGWQRGIGPLTDEEIDDCLTPSGPPALN
jgi:hypothetical protein